jgi:hypothetical protein
MMESNTSKRTARTAGGVYLVLVLTGIFSLAYVPNRLIVENNPSETYSNIIAYESLFRWGIVAGIVMYLAFLLLPLVLYRLLGSVNKNIATLMVAWAVVSVPISLMNLSHKFAVLTWIDQADYLHVFDISQRQAQVLLHLEYYNNGIQISSVFWGLWLLPFGYLVFKSGFLPKILGVFLMVGCFGYLINFTGGFLVEGYYDLGIARFISLPASIGEIGTCLWLVIVGRKTPTSQIEN